MRINLINFQINKLRKKIPLSIAIIDLDVDASVVSRGWWWVNIC